MNNYNIEEKFKRTTGYGSLGATIKYFKENYWYKINAKGYEGHSEELCSKILKASNINNFVVYEECTINGKTGCRSKNMLSEGEAMVTFSRVYEYAYGADLKSKIMTYCSVNDKINYVLDVMHEVTGLDLYDYMGQILKFDMFTYDVDRHFNNMAVILNSNGIFKEAPMFDFGASFFSMQHVFTDDMTFTEKLLKMTPQPFSNNFEEQCEFFDKVDIKFDYEKLQEVIAAEPEEIKEYVMYNMERFQDIFQNKSIGLETKKNRSMDR